MQIKDIVNRDVVNLTNCEHEPIHLPGSIQPHGFLLGLKLNDFTIGFCSENCFEYIGVKHVQLLGKGIEDLFGSDQTKKLREYISLKEGSSTAPLQLELQNKYFTCTIHRSSDIFLLEFEPRSDEKIAIADIYLQTKQFTLYMQNANTLQMLCQSVTEETRALTGYDRVMIYKFDKDYNGEVFAESKAESIEPFLGLHYPQTDIPVQARELYIKNLMRLIVDVNFTPVPLYTIDDAENKNLDLSFSNLRSVSPIHIQYLKNMGVAATMSISLMHENRLWGLIACHHYSAKYISSDIRIAAQLQGHFLTSQISVRELAEEYNGAKEVNKALANLLAQVFSTDTINLERIVRQDELLLLTNANGVIVLVEDNVYSHGNVPAVNDIKDLAKHLHTHYAQTGFHTANLSSIYPDAPQLNDTASGIIYHSLGSTHDSDSCIIWCRKESLQEVHWGGNPQKAVIKDANGLSPRKSFELWKEIRKGESFLWQKPELDAGTNFANALQKHVHMIFLANEEMVQRRLSEKLKDANAELENLNWIASHDLKEPLRKIQVFASMILEDDDISASITKTVNKMNESAQRMQTLIGDVLAYSRLSYGDNGSEHVSFYDLAKQVTSELEYEINEKNAVVEYESLPDINGIPFLLKQLLISLFRNSLKFSKANISSHIKISGGEIVASPVDPDSKVEFHKINIADNGIGFANEYKNSIFRVFSKLNSHGQYGGSGIGLALCTKIMKSHNGHITAEGNPGVGATFSLYVPV